LENTGANSQKLDNIKKQRKELKKIDWGIVTRLVITLYYGKMRRTKVAMKCNMSYDKCVLYLEWLEMMGLIKKEIDGDGFVVGLTQQGHDLYLRRFKTIEMVSI